MARSTTFSISSFQVYATLVLVLLLSQVSQPLKSSFNEGLLQEDPENVHTSTKQPSYHQTNLSEYHTSAVVVLKPNENYSISVLVETPSKAWKLIIYSLQHEKSKMPETLKCHNGTGSCVQLQLTQNDQDNPEDWDGSLREGFQHVQLTNWGTLNAYIFATIYYEPLDTQTCSSGAPKEFNCTYMVIICPTGTGKVPITPGTGGYQVMSSRSSYDSILGPEFGVFSSFSRLTLPFSGHSYELPKIEPRRCIPFTHGTDGYPQSCGSIPSIDEMDQLYNPEKYCQAMLSWQFLLVRSIGAIVFVTVPTLVIFLLFYRRQMALQRERLEREAEIARARNRSVALIDLANRRAEDIPPSYDDLYETKDPPPSFCQAVGIIQCDCDLHKSQDPTLDDASVEKLAETCKV